MILHAVLSVANFLSIVGASYITRKLFRGYGCIESDFFIAGIALTPLSLLIVSTKLLGLENIEILLVVLIISVTYTILMLYTGINKVSNISETASALSVSFMILLVLWLSKVIMTTIFD